MAGAKGNDSAAFNAVNRGKLGIVIDLNTEKGRAVFKRLARTADILVENYRPGVMAKPRARLRRAAQREPAAHLRVDLRARPDRPMGGKGRLRSGRARPVRPDVGDRHAGERPGQGWRADHRSGRGAVCGRSAFSARCTIARPPARVSTSTHRSSMPASRCRSGKSPCIGTTGQVPAPLGTAHRLTAPYQAFRCADGYITIGAANDRNFAKVARVLGHHEWLADARFTGNHSAHRAPRGAGAIDRSGDRRSSRSRSGSASSNRPASRAGRSSITKMR